MKCRHAWYALGLLVVVGLVGCGGGSGDGDGFPQQLVGTWSLQREGPTASALSAPEEGATLTIGDGRSFSLDQGAAHLEGIISVPPSRAVTFEGTYEITESTGGQDVPQVGETGSIQLALSDDGETLTMTTRAGTEDQWVQEWALESAGGLLFPRLAGNWTGQWINTTYSTQGGASLSVTVDDLAKSAQFGINLTGNVLGGSSPGLITFNATYDDNSLNGSASSTAFGDLVFQIDSDGALSATATNLPAPGVSAISVSGAVGEQTITMNYTVIFDGAVPPASGVVTLTKQ